ncbi:hypothetical protein ScPMuIL_017038 [Solemya velum]
MTGLITLLVFLALTITMVWTGISPNLCERSYKGCLSKGTPSLRRCGLTRVDGRFGNGCRRIDIQNKDNSIEYAIPSPMWFNQSG